MNDFIWYYTDLLEIDSDELVALFGPYATVVKYTMERGKRVEHVKRMPMALAVEEVLRSPTNGLTVVAAKIVDAPPGNWDMSGAAPPPSAWAFINDDSQV